MGLIVYAGVQLVLLPFRAAAIIIRAAEVAADAAAYIALAAIAPR